MKIDLHFRYQNNISKSVCITLEVFNQHLDLGLYRNEKIYSEKTFKPRNRLSLYIRLKPGFFLNPCILCLWYKQI